MDDAADPTSLSSPIVGQIGGAPRVVAGLDPADANRDITIVQQHVVSRGGEYFYSPSLAALKSGFV